MAAKEIMSNPYLNGMGAEDQVAKVMACAKKMISSQNEPTLLAAWASTARGPNAGSYEHWQVEEAEGRQECL